MKIRMDKYICLWTGMVGCLVVLASCAANAPEDIGPEDRGEPVSISFDMYTASVTKAETETTEDMVAGKTFRIYVYNSVENGMPDFSKPLASAVYTVGTDGVATGDLRLYRGSYYMYLVSYNSDSETPELTANTGQITVGNIEDNSGGKDFMYNTLKDIVVQPEAAGGNHMTVKLPTSFTRMGAQVVVKVKSKKDGQPVTVWGLTVEDIKIGGLPASRTYQLGKTKWEDCNVYDAFYQYPKEAFTRPDSEPYSFWTSTPAVLLPVDGSAELTFDVNLTVLYDGGKKSLTKVYPASIQKVLAPGMTYEFEFTLTFYGVIVATDLTLAVREYNTITLDNKDDGLGK